MRPRIENEGQTEKRSVSIRGVKLTCPTCCQPVKYKDLIEGAYCSIVCKALPKGSASIITGNYWNWGK